MAIASIEDNTRSLPMVGPNVLMVHKEPPTMLVLATGIVIGDEFPGVALDTGAYGEQWIVDEFRVFEGKVTLTN